jgi:cytoskeletal protein RodZ
MAYDPNPNDNRPDLRTPPPAPRGSSSWMGWVAVLAVIVVGAFVWSQMGSAPTDATMTSSTTQPATPAAPAPATPAPATPEPAPAPATPAPATPAPSAPANGG